MARFSHMVLTQEQVQMIVVALTALTVQRVK
jgi:hypothetical protein